MAYSKEELEGMDAAALRSAARSMRVNPAGRTNADIIREILKQQGGGNTPADPNGAAKRAPGPAVASVAKPSTVATQAPKPAPVAPVARPASAPQAPKPAPVAQTAPRPAVAAPQAQAPKPAPVAQTAPRPATQAASVAQKPSPVAAAAQAPKPAPAAAPSMDISSVMTILKSLEAKFKDLMADHLSVRNRLEKAEERLAVLETAPVVVEQSEAQAAEVPAQVEEAAPAAEEEGELTHELLDAMGEEDLLKLCEENQIEITAEDTLESIKDKVRALMPPREGEVIDGDGIVPENPAAREALIGKVPKLDPSSLQSGMEVRICAPEDEGFGNQVWTGKIEKIGPYQVPTDDGSVQLYGASYVHVAVNEADGSVSDAHIPNSYLYPPAARVARVAPVARR